MNWKQRLTLARERGGMTKAQLSRLAKVSGPTVTDWEGEKTKMIDGANLVKVAEILRVTPEWIINGSGSLDADDAEVIQEFSWVYRNANPDARASLRYAIKAARMLGIVEGAPRNTLAFSKKQ